MAVNKITSPITPLEEVAKINEIIDNLSSGGTEIDNKSITTNDSSQLQTVGVINSRDSSTAIKTWTGTRQQYDGILSKDANTLYNTDNGLFLGTTEVANISSNRNIGEIIKSTIPLTDAGLHLLDGSLISGSGSYSAFVDYMANLYNNNPKYSDINLIGSLVDTNGVLSGFSISNYAKIPQQLPLASATSFECVAKFTYNTSTGAQSVFAENNVSYFSQISILANGKIYTQLSNSHSSNNIGTGTGITTLNSGSTYYVKFTFNGSVYKVYLSSTGAFNGEESEEISITSSSKLLTYDWNIGCSDLLSYEQPFSAGSIDLNECYININGSRRWTGRQPISFTEEASWQQSVTDYSVCGKFVYDNINNTVRLPKYSDKIYTSLNTAPVKGNGKSLGFTNGSQFAGLQDSSSASGNSVIFSKSHYNVTAGSGSYISDNPFSNGQAIGITTEASKSGVIADLSNITTALDGYYYIVIATSVKTNIEVDIDEVMTDLNNKADVDLNNITQSGKNVIMNVNLPDYSSVTSGTLSNYTGSITLTKKSMVIVSCQVGAYKIGEIYVNGNVASLATNPTGSAVYCTASPIFADVGDVITFNSNWSSNIVYYLYPLKGES